MILRDHAERMGRAGELVQVRAAQHHRRVGRDQAGEQDLFHEPRHGNPDLAAFRAFDSDNWYISTRAVRLQDRTARVGRLLRSSKLGTDAEISTKDSPRIIKPLRSRIGRVRLPVFERMCAGGHPLEVRCRCPGKSSGIQDVL